MSEITIHPVNGDLSTSGIQYDAGVSTTDANTKYYSDVLTISIGLGRRILCIEAGLTHMQKAMNATADVKYVWQISPDGTNYTDLFTEVTVADINTTYVTYSYAGYIDVDGIGLFDSTFYLRLAIESNETSAGSGHSLAYVKNSSYVTVTYI